MSMKTICDVINKSGSNDFVNRACYYTKQRTLQHSALIIKTTSD